MTKYIKIFLIGLFVLTGFFFFSNSASARTLDLTFVGTTNTPASFMIFATSTLSWGDDVNDADRVCVAALSDTDSNIDACVTGAVANTTEYRVQVIIKESATGNTVVEMEGTNTLIHRNVWDWAGSGASLGSCMFRDFGGDDIAGRVCAVSFTDDDIDSASDDVQIICSNCSNKNEVMIANDAGEEGYAYMITTGSAASASTSYWIDHMGTNSNEQSSLIGILGPSVVVSVYVKDTTVAYGTVPLSGGKCSTTTGDTQYVINNGSGTENFNIKGTDTTDWDISTSSIGADRYMHLFTTTTGNYWPEIDNEYITLETGVAANGTSTVDFYFFMPSSDSSSFSEQSTNVTIQAVAP